jgi:hypothetical protein
MKLPRESPTFFSVAELGEIVGIDIDTVNNWLRHAIINRARIGGRQLRSRLFSTEEVYKAGLKNELVKLGIAPSRASEAVNAVWKEWSKKEAPEGWNVYALVWPTNDKWNIALCSQKISGGPLYKLRKGKSSEEMDLPRKAFAVIPISDIFDRVTSTLSELLGDVRNQRG